MIMYAITEQSRLIFEAVFFHSVFLTANSYLLHETYLIVFAIVSLKYCN